MTDYSGLTAGDDLYAPEHINALAAAAPIDEYIDFGLGVTANGDGTVTIAEGKFYIILAEALAEWTDDSGTSHSQTVHNSLMYAHTDSRTKNLASTTDTNYVFAWVNYTINDDPRIFINDTGAAIPPNETSEVDDALEIARVDPVAGEVKPRNQYPSGTFGSLTVNGQLTDPAGVVHTDELADADDVPTSADINEAVADNPDHGSEASHNYYRGDDAVRDINNETTLDVGITGAAGSVAGADVDGPVAEAVHASEADNADAVGTIPPSDFLRTDTEDEMAAPIDFGGHAAKNVSTIPFADSAPATPAIDLRGDTDGVQTVVAHEDPDTGEEYHWVAQSGAGIPMGIYNPTDEDSPPLFQVGADGRISALAGGFFEQGSRVATQDWSNDKFIPSSGGRVDGPLDLQGETLAGVDTIQPTGDGDISIHSQVYIPQSVIITDAGDESDPTDPAPDVPIPDIDLDLAIGDIDTGLKQVGDGKLGFFSNGTKLFHLAPGPDAIRFANKIGMADDIRMIEHDITEINRASFTDVATGAENNHVRFENGDFVVDPQGESTRRY